MRNKLIIIEELSRKNLKWLKKHCRTDYTIFCINQSDNSVLNFVKDCKFVNLASYYFELTEISFELLESEIDRVNLFVKELSSLLKLDVSTALYRYLLGNYYIKKARVEKIKSLYDLDKYEAIYVDKNHIICEGFFNVLSLRPKLSKYYTFVLLCFRSIKSLKNIIKSNGNKVDLLLFIDSGEYGYLSKVPNMLRTANVNFMAVDKTGNNRKVCDLNQHNGYIYDRFYKYFFKAAYNQLKCINSRRISFFSSFVYNSLFAKSFFQELYIQFHPRVVLFANEYDIFQSIGYHQLKKNDVVALNFMHGEKMYMLRDALAEYDDYMVWGDYYKHLFDRLRYRGKRISVTGNPTHDAIINYQVTDKELINIRKSHKKVISVYTQSLKSPERLLTKEWVTQMITDICDYARHRRDVFVFVKNHSNELSFSAIDYDKIIGSLQNVKRCCKEYKLYDLVTISDLILTPYSTVGLEAILFGKNVIYLNYGAVRNLIPYALENSAIELNDNINFEYYVDRLLDGSIKLNRQKTIELHANGLDGHSAQHVFEQIIKYL
jgi:hypothetical protein